MNVAGLAASEANKSRKGAEALLAAFDSIADRAGLSHERILEKCLTHKVPDVFVEYGRLRDLMIVPVPEAYDQWYAEAVIFGTGKPTLVLPEGPGAKRFELNTGVVAWDFSRRRSHFDRAGSGCCRGGRCLDVDARPDTGRGGVREEGQVRRQRG